MPSKTVTIKRSKWRRPGYGSAHTMLYNPNEPTSYQFCCLGQYLRQCDIPMMDMASRVAPGDVEYDEVTADIEALVKTDMGHQVSTRLADRAMVINDSEKLSDAEREHELIELFGGEYITLVFVD